MAEAAIKFTYLIENHAAISGLASEHGLSVFVQDGTRHILFDTGQSPAFLENADRLDVPLALTDCIVLSHGHYDHGGGLEAFLRTYGGRPVYVHPAAFEQKVSLEQPSRDIGLQLSRAEYEALGAQFLEVTHPVQLSEHLLLTGEVPRRPGNPEGITGLGHLDAAGRVEPDPMKDDMSLIAQTEGGLVLQLGCGHSGMLNIADYALELVPELPLVGIFGGTHMVVLNDEQLEYVLRRLEELKVRYVGACHCTGEYAARVLAHALCDRFVQLGAGSRITLEESGELSFANVRSLAG